MGEPENLDFHDLWIVGTAHLVKTDSGRKCASAPLPLGLGRIALATATPSGSEALPLHFSRITQAPLSRSPGSDCCLHLPESARLCCSLRCCSFHEHAAVFRLVGAAAWSVEAEEVASETLRAPAHLGGCPPVYSPAVCSMRLATLAALPWSAREGGRHPPTPAAPSSCMHEM